MLIPFEELDLYSNVEFIVNKKMMVKMQHIF